MHPLCARTSVRCEEAKRHARAFEEKRVEKTYLALCRRRSNEVDIAPRETFSTIDVPLAKTSSSKTSSSSSFRVEARPDGKPSVTLWRILAARGEHALVQCRPETGRTHQIRAHWAHVGFPIVGDALYGARAFLSAAINREKHPDGEITWGIRDFRPHTT